MSPDVRNRDEALVRRFTVVGLWVLVFNGILGAGIFGLPARIAGLTGPYSPLFFVVCGLLMAPIVLTFAEAASYVRATGGPILYVGTVFGPHAAFQTGWAIYVSRATAFAANVNLLVDSLGWIWEAASAGTARVALIAGICGFLTLVNVLGSRQAMRTAGTLTVLKIAPLLVLVVAGFVLLSPALLPAAGTPLPSAASAGSAALIAIYAFVGWEVALVPAGEAKDPARDLPRALLLGLASIVVFYVLIQAVCIAALPDLARSERPLVDAAAALLGPAGAALLLFGTVASIGGNLAVSVISASRTTYALAQEGTLPAFFGRVHARYRTPAVSVVVFGTLVTALALSGSFIWLAGLSVLSRVLVFLLVIAALPGLRRRFGKEPGTFRLPGGYAIPALAAIVSVGLTLQAQSNAVWTTLAFLAVGSVLFAAARLRG
jgi:amino acid transporter